MKTCGIVILMLVSFASHATDNKGNYAIWGVGNRSCHGYLQARAANDFDKFKDYLMGFLTAYNVMTPETYSISGGKNLDEVLIWFDDHCELQPTISFEQAITDFIAENFEQRMKTSPSSFRR
ncbi:MAG: peptidoglycan binding protein [Gammaproteobacteria bacterium]|nr:peptidoglycan binding protein [Gammaproteobacteria bacterium]